MVDATAIILAAGRGSRLHPFTENCPKCLTELGGRSLIQNQIDTMRSVGIENIIILTGYLAEMLELPGTQQIHNPNWANTNMVESLFCAEPFFGKDLIVSYGDIIYQPGLIKSLLNSPHDISVLIDEHWQPYWEQRFDNPLCDAETLKLDPLGRIIEIGNTPSSINEIEAQYTGLMRFKNTGIANLIRAHKNLGKSHRQWLEQRPLNQAYMTDLLMEMILTGHDTFGILTQRGWFEIDTPKDLEVARACL